MSQVNSVNGNTLLYTGFFPPCRAGSTVAITLAGLQTVDGIALNDGDRVLVKDQADATTNGIYAANSGNWVRTSDALSSTQFYDGMAVMVAQGTLNAATIYLCTTTDDPVIIGTSLLTFVSLSTINTVSAAMRPVVQAPTISAAVTLLGLGAVFKNTRLAKTSNYTVANADKGKTIALGGGVLFLLQFSAASGYDADFSALVVNEDTTRGKIIQINGYSNFILWPGQSMLVFAQNNVWQFQRPGRWIVPSALVLNVDPTNGSDTNDGLATTTGAFRTLQAAVTALWRCIDNSNYLPTISVAAGSTITESFTLTQLGQLTGASTVFIQGGGGAFTWKPASGYCLQVGDQSIVIISNVTFDGTGTVGNIAISGHQTGVLDVNAGVTFGSFPSGYHFFNDTHFKININNNFTISGGFTYHFIGAGDVQYSYGASNITVTVTGTPSGSAYFRMFGAGNGVSLSGGSAWSGAFTAGMQQWAITGPSAISSGGATVPGSVAGSATNGGQAF